MLGEGGFVLSFNYFFIFQIPELPGNQMATDRNFNCITRKEI